MRAGRADHDGAKRLDRLVLNNSVNVASDRDVGPLYVAKARRVSGNNIDAVWYASKLENSVRITFRKEQRCTDQFNAGVGDWRPITLKDHSSNRGRLGCGLLHTTRGDRWLLPK